MDDLIKDARERFDACREATNDQRMKMLDDLRFSNPADPQQWPDEIRRLRETAVGGSRPCLTFDQTNQFIAQVVNHWRQNKAAIKVRPVDSGADPKVADALQGIIRHIEDTSKADIAYDMALEYAARMGLGWIRIGTEIVNDARNEQEIVIKRVSDPLSVMLDPDWEEPDGSDAMFGFIESNPSQRAFKRQYPKAEIVDWQGDGESSDWFAEKTVRVCEYFNINETKTKILVVDDPLNPGNEMELEEADYRSAVQQIGYEPPIVRTYYAKKRHCDWYKLTGEEILEQTIFPSTFIPLVPVIGSELWVEGKRELCGMVRPMKDPMRAYNYDRSNYIEHVSLQTKIPYLVAAEAVEGFEDDWAAANRSNAAYLVYNAFDSENQPLPAPRREMPPAASNAYVQGAIQAQNDIQASIGMYRANLGAPSNETSGRAIAARQSQGDTANFHYADGMARSIRQVGRIIIEMIPKVYDTRREARIIGDDGSTSMVTVDPDQQMAAAMKGAKLASMNPAIGRYDVSVVAGPAFGTRRAEAVEAMKEIIAGNPQMMALIGDEFVKMMDIPGADKIAKRLATMLPPQIQQAESAEKEGQESAEVLAVKQQAEQAMQQQGEQMQQLQMMAQELQQELQKCQQQLADKSADRDTSLQEEQIKASASVQEAQIKASADVEIARLNAEAVVNTPQPQVAPAQAAPAAQPHQVQVITGSEQVLGEQLSALVQQVGQQNAAIAEQSGHLFLAVSAIADELTKPKVDAPEKSRIQGRMMRQADGSYTVDVTKNETA